MNPALRSVYRQPNRPMRATCLARALVGTLGIIGLISCSRTSSPPTADITILHTGRMRGNAYPQGISGAIPLQYYPYLAGYVKQVRADAVRNGGVVVVGDVGDSLSGSFAAHVTGGHNMVTLFNAVGYDFVALGNLDSNVSQETIQGLKSVVLCPFVGPDGEPAMPGTRTTARIQSGKYAVDLLANFNGDLDPATDPLRFPASFGPSNTTSRPVREYAKPKGAPADLTLLTWMKFEAPQNPPKRFLDMLTSIGVDLILAQRVYGKASGETWKTSPAKNWIPPVSENILRNNLGFTVARADLKRTPTGWQLLSEEVVPLTSNTAPPDPAAVEALSRFARIISDADQRVAILDKPFYIEEIYGTYLAALSGIPDVEAIVYSPESIRVDWAAGELRSGKVFEALPWTSKLIILELSAAQLDQVRTIPRLEVYSRKPSDGQPVHAITSEYFAQVIRHKLGQVATRSLPDTSEFDFFVDSLLESARRAPSAPLAPSKLDPEVWHRD